MSTPIRVRVVLHGPKGEGRIWGEWKHFPYLGHRDAIEMIHGCTRGGKYVQVSRSNRWEKTGHQRFTYATPDGLNHATVHVLNVRVHGCECDSLAYPPGHACGLHPHMASCACVECLLELF